jgi:hypothetical protein
MAVIKKLPKIPSSSTSSEESSNEEQIDGDIDHTYNPYSFKKLEKAIFSKPKAPV